MSNGTSSLEALFESAKQYTHTSVELLKLKAIEKVADTVSSIISRLVVIIVMALFFLILNIGIALYLGELMGKSYYGFFVVAGFYMLLGLIIHSFREALVKMPVLNAIIKKVFK